MMEGVRLGVIQHEKIFKIVYSDTTRKHVYGM